MTSAILRDANLPREQYDSCKDSSFIVRLIILKAWLKRGWLTSEQHSRRQFGEIARQIARGGLVDDRRAS